MDSLKPLGGGVSPTPPPPGPPSTPPPVPPPPAYRPPMMAGPPVKRRSPILGWVIGLVVVAAIIGGVWYFVFANSPSATVNAFIAAAEEMNFDKMTHLCTAESQQLMALAKPFMAMLSGPETKKEMQKAKEGMSKLGIKSSHRVTGTKITGDRAEVNMTFTSSMGGRTSTSTSTIPLRKEGGKWRIDLASEMKGMGGPFGGMPGPGGGGIPGMGGMPGMGR